MRRARLTSRACQSSFCVAWRVAACACKGFCEPRGRLRLRVVRHVQLLYDDAELDLAKSLCHMIQVQDVQSRALARLLHSV